MDAEIGFWLVIGVMAFFGALGFLARLAIWAVFYFGSKGKLKVTIKYPEEKNEENK